jgi:hypothetical protein
MIPFKLILTTLIALAVCISNSKAQGIKKIFDEGNKKKYQLILEEWHNEKLNSLTKSICELTTVKDSGYYYEEVKWISKVQITQKDSLVQDSIAAKVKPYKIALEAGGKLEIPKIDMPEMTQPIQDFTTFFVAISPQLGIAHLNKVGDIYNVPDNIKGNFANGSFILKGEDCFRVSLKFESLDSQVAIIGTSFEPPKEACLSYLLPEMDSSIIANIRNNFQMVMPSNDKLNIQYGVEEFRIESHLNNTTGLLEYATMINTLTLKLKINCNSNYQDCSFEMPFTIIRKLKVELLD